MEPVILIHGFMGVPEDWDEVRQFVSRPTVAIRIPVLSSWDATICVMSSICPPKGHLVGYSMGARLALGIALACPERFVSVTMVSGNPGIDPSERGSRLRHDEELAAAMESLSDDDGKRSFLRRWYDQGVFRGLTDEQIATLVQRRMKVDPVVAANQLRVLSVAKQPDYRGRLHMLPKVLMIAGERDQKYAGIARRSAQLSRGVNCAIIPDCGHILPFEQPRSLADTINRFVD